jgi:hypothetical protein
MIHPAIQKAAPNDPERQRLLAAILAEVLGSDAAAVELSFTGVIVDSIGRKRHYRDGKQVAGPPDAEATPAKPIKPADRTDPRVQQQIRGRQQRRAVAEKVSGAAQAVARPVKAAGDAVAYAAKKVGEAAWKALPAPVQKGVSTLYKIVQKIEHGLEAVVRGSETMVRQVCKERGLSDKHAISAARWAGLVNMASRWSYNVPVVHTALEAAGWATGGAAFAAAKAGYYVPVGSLCYLAYSLARNPLAVSRAAQKLFAGNASSAAPKGASHATA